MRRPCIPSGIRGDIELLMSELFPVYRTLMGSGFDRSLEIIERMLPMSRHTLTTGTSCGSWRVPDAWYIRDAWLDNAQGRRIVDLSTAPFMVWQYSESTDSRVSLETLRKHLAVGPKDAPDAFPSVVTYYRREWGISLSHRLASSLSDGDYRVCIDAGFEPGHLSIGSVEIPGRSHEIVLIDAVLSCAALANNLSGVVAAAVLGRLLSTIRDPKFTYRVLFTPETLGPIATHFHFPGLHENVVGGLTLGNLGHGDTFTYRRSRPGRTPVDRAVEHVMSRTGRPSSIEQYDVKTGTCGNEKAYNSLGIEIPIGAMRRAPLGSYPEYDTSADDINFISMDLIEDAVAALWECVYCLENDAVYVRTFEGEPFLTGHAIFPGSDEERLYFDYLMAFTDGQHSLLQIADRAKVPIWEFEHALRLMCHQGLLRPTQ